MAAAPKPGKSTQDTLLISEIKDGDCNGCHTEAGRADEGPDYANGRIVAP